MLFLAGTLTAFPLWVEGNTHTTFNKELLNRIDEDIRRETYGKISSIVIYSDNKLVHEVYYGFSLPSTLHPISSVTKSITSIAVGVCLDQGYIESLDDPIYYYFPEFLDIFSSNPLKKRITIRHLLAQTSGLKWDEWSVPYSYAGNPLADLRETHGSWLPIILGLPMDTIPGTQFVYNSAGSDLIKEIISRSSAMEFLEFVDYYIFRPLEITHYRWDTYFENGHPAWGGISLTTRDMAKVGLLMLNKGLWKGNRVVSEDWVNLSTSTAVSINGTGYGLHWWISYKDNPIQMFYAAGYGDQYVYVIPKLKMVIAINGQNFTSHKWDADSLTLLTKILKACSCQS